VHAFALGDFRVPTRFAVTCLFAIYWELFDFGTVSALSSRGFYLSVVCPSEIQEETSL
jgi:hypothetical protein